VIYLAFDRLAERLTGRRPRSRFSTGEEGA